MERRVRENTKAVFRTLVTVFKKPIYATLAVASALSVWLLVIIMPRLETISYLVGQSSLTMGQKIRTIWYTLIGGTVTLGLPEILVGLLIGINLTLIVYYFKKYIALHRLSGAGIAGTLFGLIGMGCASCGSVLLTSVIGITASTHLIGILPLKGLEFTILSIILLGVSIITIALHIDKPAQCAITSK